MLRNTLIDSIKKPGTFSSGALPLNYTESWNQKSSKYRQKEGLSIPLEDDVPTNIRSSRVNLEALENFLHHNASLSIDSYAIFNLLGQALSVSSNSPVQRSLDELTLISTSTVPVLRFLGISNFPVQIKEYFDDLQACEKDEDALYEIAEAIVGWLTNNSDEYQKSLVLELEKMPSIAQRIFVATLSDKEVQVSNENLLNLIGSFLESTDKLLAQSSATCLLTCAGLSGKNILQSKLSTKDLPHSQLIQGIMKLFS